MKKRTGRPRLKEDEDTVRFLTVVPTSLDAAIIQAARERGVSKAEVIRTALAKHLNLVEV